MAEPTSFGNIVNTLRAVRQDYHEQLKSFPQYEAFLLIESSTEKAAGALQGSNSSSIATDVIDSLQFARNRFEQHMTCIPEYRVLVAIDKLIKDVLVDLGPQGDAQEGATESAAEPAAATEHAAPEEIESAPVAEQETPAEMAEDAPEVPTEMEAPADVEAEHPAPAEASEVAQLDIDIDAPPLAPVDLDADDAGLDDDIIQLHIPREHVTESDEDDDLIVAVKAEA